MVLSRRGCPLLRGFASAAAESRAVGLRSRLISSRLKDPLQSLHPLCLAIYVKTQLWVLHVRVQFWYQDFSWCSGEIRVMG